MSTGYAVATESTRQRGNPKRPGFIKRWLYKVAEEAWNYRQSHPDAIAGGDRVHEGLSADPIRINVYSARGGKIVEVRSVNSGSSGLNHPKGYVGGNNATTYIITDQQDFTEELGKIISMESLRV